MGKHTRKDKTKENELEQEITDFGYFCISRQNGSLALCRPTLFF
jgi:hypothetical protein